MRSFFIITKGISIYNFRRLMNSTRMESASPVLGSNNEVYINEETQFLEQLEQVVEKKKANSKKMFDESDISDQTCQKIAMLAERHAQANIFNYSSMLDEKEMEKNNIEVCQCGCKKGEGEKLPICMNEENLSFLGPGVLLFFFYLKCLRISISLFAIGYGSFALLSNLFSPNTIDFTACEQADIQLERLFCSINVATTYDRNQYLFKRVFQMILGCILGIVWLFTIKFISFLGQRKNQQIDEMLESASDFTIRIENLPSGNYNENDLLQFINQIWNKEEGNGNGSLEPIESENFRNPLELKSIQIIYNMTQCRDLIKKIQDSSLKVHKYLNSDKKIHQDFFSQYNVQKQEYLLLYEDLRQLQNKFKKNDDFRRNISTTCALISFRTENQQKYFLQKFGQKKTKSLADLCRDNNSLEFKQKSIAISRAPEPSDINWANCQIEWSYFRYIMIWVVTIIILYACYALISYTNTLEFVRNTEGILVSLVLQIFNRIIWSTLSYLVSFEYHNTKTQAIISLMKKSIFAQVMNVIVIPIFLKFFNNRPLYGDGSLSSTILVFQFIMFFMMTFFYVLNPLYFLKKIGLCIKYLRNKIIRSKAEVVGEIDTFSEIKPVFTYYEGTQFPIAGAYVYMITATFFTLFYCHLQPITIFILILNISGFYFILKYLLFRRSKIPELTNFQVFQFALFILSFGSVFYSLGSLFFVIVESYEVNSDLSQLSVYQPLPSALCLIILFVLSTNPFGVFNKVNNFLFVEFNFTLRSFQSLNKEKVQTKEQVGISLIAKILTDPNLSFKRKQSYYSSSNANKLLNFEYQLKEIRNEKVNEHKEFCESFFNQGRPLTTTKSRKKSKQYDNILIPVELSKQNRIKRETDNRYNPKLIIRETVKKQTALDEISQWKLESPQESFKNQEKGKISEQITFEEIKNISEKNSKY